MTVKIIDRRDVIKTVPEGWRIAYGRGHWANDADKQAIQAKLDQLDLDTCTKEDIASIIGNNSWTEQRCIICSADAGTVMQIGDEPDHDARWQIICLPCAVELGKQAELAIEAKP